MSNMPERIWAEPITGQQPSHGPSQWGLYHPGDPNPLATEEYIRADVANAEIERLKEAMWAQHERNVELAKETEQLNVNVSLADALVEAMLSYGADWSSWRRVEVALDAYQWEKEKDKE